MCVEVETWARLVRQITWCACFRTSSGIAVVEKDYAALPASGMFSASRGSHVRSPGSVVLFVVAVHLDHFAWGRGRETWCE